MAVNEEWLQFVIGELQPLLLDRSWSGTQEQRALAVQRANHLLYILSEGAMVGAVGDVGVTFAQTLPDDRLFCEGQALLRVDYPALYDALDSSLIVDADNFHLPDLRGRAVFGAGNGLTVGDTGGVQEHTLTLSEIPSHEHQIYNRESVGSNPDLYRYAQAGTSGDNGVGLSRAAGGGQPHNNMPPYAVGRYWIKVI